MPKSPCDDTQPSPLSPCVVNFIENSEFAVFICLGFFLSVRSVFSLTQLKMQTAIPEPLPKTLLGIKDCLVLISLIDS